LDALVSFVVPIPVDLAQVPDSPEAGESNISKMTESADSAKSIHFVNVPNALVLESSLVTNVLVVSDPSKIALSVQISDTLKTRHSLVSKVPNSTEALNSSQISQTL
jgi:hypothetical protein